MGKPSANRFLYIAGAGRRLWKTLVGIRFGRAGLALTLPIVVLITRIAARRGSRIDIVVPGQQSCGVSSAPPHSALAHLARWMDRARRIAGKYGWIWPLIGAVILIIIGVWVRDDVDHAVRNELADHLQTVLNAEVAALRLWVREKQGDVESLAADRRVQDAAAALVTVFEGRALPAEPIARPPAANELLVWLKPFLEAQGYAGFVLVSAVDRRILLSFDGELIGQKTPPGYEEFLRRTFRGQSTVTRPFASEVPLPSADRTNRVGVPTMFVAAPIRSAAGGIIAALALRLQPDREFDRLFAIAYVGETGETNPIDRSGVKLTSGRFEDEAQSLGLFPAGTQGAALNLRLLDPGTDLRRHAGSPQRARALGLTRMAADAVEGRSGLDTKGYRDYRGVLVVGAWTWLPDFRMGVTTEVSVREAFEPFYIVRRAFYVLFGCLLFAAALILAFTIALKHVQVAARRTALAAKQLGQYVLLEPIGSGGYGKVYKARHAMLRRPVAIKLLDPEKTNETTLARFEREVQATSQLTHPNTVAIYDYGRTPEGVFYYAMELLDGINLEHLVKQFGPLPSGRVIDILRQVCGSLAEAHAVGLIHRDVTPANILLTRRGGLFDVAKVLDFGVVQPIHPAIPLEVAAADSILGTPGYLSPEAIEFPNRIDARSDLYSLGAVAYFLLTGKLLFELATLEDLLRAQIKTVPARPSTRANLPLDAELENLIMRCLSKKPEQRPSSANALAELLAECPAAETWDLRLAERWWQQYFPKLPPEREVSLRHKTLTISRPYDGAGKL